MAYSTVANVRIITGFTALNSSGEEKIGDTVIQRAIDEADSVIDGKIGDRYQLPLPATPPKLIQLISEQLAKGILYAEEYGEESENLDKGWEKTMNYYLGLLDDIADGNTTLRDPDTGDELPRSTVDLPDFYPNDTSEDDPDNPTYSHITVNSEW